jgi:hypothetical protein
VFSSNEKVNECLWRSVHGRIELLKNEQKLKKGLRRDSVPQAYRSGRSVL